MVAREPRWGTWSRSSCCSKASPRATNAVHASVTAMTAAFAGISFDHDRMRAALSDDILATEAADRLVDRGTPFRQAHHAVGETVAAARRRGIGLKELARSAPGEVARPLGPNDLLTLDFNSAVERRTATGGTSTSAIREQLAAARSALVASRRGAG